MIWEQDTRTIVMMTNLQEKGRIKCDQYWPNQSSEKFGNISVVVLETVELAHYTVRTFRLCKDGQSDKSREIKQYQYTAWPDHGVPHYSTSLLCFIRKVRLANPSDAGPVIVHCSAGVGRTGVFIVIDSMLEKMRREQSVDVYGHVTLLRSQRNHMVQTEEQYIFIHETLLEAVLFGNTEIHASDLSQYYKKLNEIGVNETTTSKNISRIYSQLSVFCHTHRFVTPILAANKSKNRYPKIIPYEHSRVDLVPVRSVDGSNYINASYIDGYKQRRTYIAAQGPLEETVNDFWRMIMEKKSNIVVMLSGTDDNDQ
ncbi:receptor-type tyrosine- phosphatase S, partial, partial [Paramuricea clavata]